MAGYLVAMPVQHLGCEVTLCPECGRRSLVVTYEGLSDPARPDDVVVWLPTHAACEHGCDLAGHLLPGLWREAA